MTEQAGLDQGPSDHTEPTDYTKHTDSTEHTTTNNDQSTVSTNTDTIVTPSVMTGVTGQPSDMSTLEDMTAADDDSNTDATGSTHDRITRSTDVTKDVTELIGRTTDVTKDVTELIGLTTDVTKDVTELIRMTTDITKDVTELITTDATKDVTELIESTTENTENTTMGKGEKHEYESIVPKLILNSTVETFLSDHSNCSKKLNLKF